MRVGVQELSRRNTQCVVGVTVALLPSKQQAGVQLPHDAL